MDIANLIDIDNSILLLLNGGESVFVDTLMLTLTSGLTWIPLYIALLFLVIKNNENYNLPNLNKQVAIKKQYLDKFKYIIDTLPEKDVNFIMHGNYINVAENAMAQNNFKVANEFYSKASQYGGLSAREWFRRLVFPIYNIVKRK